MKTTLHKIYIPNNSSITLVNGSDIVLADDFTVETGTGTSGRIDMVTEDGEEVTAVEDRPELPSWDEAPEWAQWRVINSLGMLIHTEYAPDSISGNGCDITESALGRWDIWRGGRSNYLYPCPDNWKDTIEQRPVELPSWDEAPEWAQWRAVNKFGVAAWWEKRPTMISTGWFKIPDDNRYRVILDGSFTHIPWQDSIEQRPFEPPWDKIASPYDEYVLSGVGAYPRFYVRGNCSGVNDMWTPVEEYSRIERGHMYRRPSK